MINAKKLATSTHLGTSRLTDSYQSCGAVCQSDTDKKGVLGARKKKKKTSLHKSRVAAEGDSSCSVQSVRSSTPFQYPEEQMVFDDVGTPSNECQEEETCCNGRFIKVLH